MLKKLLLWIQKLTKKRRTLENQPQNHKTPSANSGNLLTDTQLHKEQSTYNKKLISFFQLGIFISGVVFLLLAYYNSYLNSYLTDLKKEQDSLVKQVQEYTDLRKQAQDLYEDIEYYKNTQKSKDFLGQKLKLIQDIPQGAVIKSLSMDTLKFNIAVEGKATLSITQMIVSYLETNQITQIQINSAVYESGQGLYKVMLTGYF